MTTHLTAFQHATSLATRQFGTIHRRQALAAGLSDHQIRRLANSGVWIRRLRAVFVVAGSTDGPQQRAMVAYLAGEAAGAVLSHVTAAAFDALLPHSPLPHLAVPPGHSPRCGVAKVHRIHVPPQDVVHRTGMRLTSVSRTLVDLATLLNRAALEEVVDDAFCRRLASPTSVAAALGRAAPNARGRDLIRSVVAVWSESIRPESVGEARLLRQLADLGMRGMVTQHEVVDADGRFVARLDVADPERRVAFEYDGLRHHNPRGWERDEARYARLRALGWEVEAITKLDLLPGESRLRHLLERWYGTRAA